MFSRYRNRNNSFNHNIKNLKLPLLLALAPFGLAACGGGGGGGDYTAPSLSAPTAIPFPPADYSAVDAAFQEFLDNHEVLDGISYTLVDKEGTTHQAVFGDHTEDLVTILASTSKVPAVMAILALDDDPSVDFSISEPVSEYLPFGGIYADRTVEQMISNTSGIPGLRVTLSPAYIASGGGHNCQATSQPFMTFEGCGQLLVSTELPTTHPAGSIFDYGGSQWQVAGVTASVANNSSWNQLFDEYLGAPCDLDVFTFGNPYEELIYSGFTYTSFDGTPASLVGQHNPNIEGGGITNLSDYAKLLQVLLNGGNCGSNQVLSQASIDSMFADKGSAVPINPTPYGMGWWISTESPGVYTDGGMFGAVSFIDLNTGVGGFIAIDDYSRRASGQGSAILRTALPLIQEAVRARYE